MENCVECILVHGDGSPEELIRKLSTLPAGSTAAGNTAAAVNDIDADEELARQLAAESNNYARTTTNNAAAAAARRQQLQEQRRPMASTVSAPSSSSSSPSRSSRQQTKGRGTPTILPSDFLRIPGRNYSSDNIIATSSSAAVTNNNEQLPVNSNGMTDEQLARMLQDELFQEELRNNPEFSHLAHGGGRGGQQQQRARQQQQQQQGPDFFDKLSELGDVAKNRFQAFAAGWNTQNSSGGGGGGLFGVGGGNNTNATPSPRGNERRGLLSGLDMDEDEEEMDFVGGSSGGGGRDVELQSVGRSGDKKTD